jgi:hypothetical protein
MSGSGDDEVDDQMDDCGIVEPVKNVFYTMIGYCPGGPGAAAATMHMGSSFAK